MSKFENIAQCVLDGEFKKVKGLVNKAMDDGAKPMDIINEGLIGGMNLVTPLFKTGEMFVPEVMKSAKTMNIGMELLKEHIKEGDLVTKGVIVTGTVKGDLHDIGKNLVGMMLESSGYTVIDLGTDIEPEDFLKAIEEQKPDIIGMSALLTTTMMNIKETIDFLQEKGVRDKVKIMIGGAPISQEFADQVGADGYGEDAAAAVELCDSLLSEKAHA
ncbi:5-methyltetrahydrofolate--homocysteine methyltransferase [Alkalibaculum bacchi]|uniref:5-methyltetrahydrofolate--homocysteine methyltransferase n=1 Tax=Alkalibaculum bacchi TaxID=645887 RepID=A0A366I9M4_9FIRM|nr:corrinoid protein [Alkalibaculum bacchi]RBP66652.1 5-methyltetrahydrofolate--homocysteine methyltransferase [Alkalibaculum bacchi]